VVEVHAVTDPTEIDERSPREQRRERTRHARCGDGGRARDGEHGQPALVGRTRPARPRDGSDDHDREADPAERSQATGHRPAVDDHREEGADEDLGETRRRRPVHGIGTPASEGHDRRQREQARTQTDRDDA